MKRPCRRGEGDLLLWLGEGSVKRACRRGEGNLLLWLGEGSVKRACRRVGEKGTCCCGWEKDQ